MTTYIQKKERVFCERGDVQPERSRNVGEMKRIGSCIDRRAWATNDEERRQHILEYKKAKAAFGTYVPVDVLIDLVCATKNAEIEALSKKVEELEKLLEIYNGLELTPEQRGKLKQMTAQMNESVGASADGLDGLESSFDDQDNSESTTYGGVCTGQNATQTQQDCTDNTFTQTAGANADEVGAINIDFNIDGSAELEIDVEPVCEPDCGAPTGSAGGGGTSGGDLQCLLAQRDREIVLLKEENNRLKRQLAGESDLEKKLTHSQLALASAQQEKAQLAKAITSSKTPELVQLEEEIACLRSNPNLTPEQETEIIKKELDVLKRYCDQLSNIQEENDQLKLENNYLKAQFGDCDDIQALKQRSAMLENMTCERDNLRTEVQRLAGGMEILRKRSEAADILEREKCQLQKELSDLNRARRQSDYDLELALSENEDVQKTLEMTRCERDGLRDKITANECAYSELQRQTMQLQAAHQDAENNCQRLQGEVNRLRVKAKEGDVYRLERDRLQLRVEELSALEVEVLTLVEKVKNLSIERDVLKRQSCDQHNIIADQEHEIKGLLLHVDRLSQCVEKQQERIRTALDELQCELEHKNFLLATSQEQLQNESQQRLCFAQLECELRETIDELKSELKEKEEKLRCLESSVADVKETKCSAVNDDIEKLERDNQRLRERIQQLECVCAHRHVDEILESSKQAVGVVIDEIKNKRSLSPDPTSCPAHENYMLEENKQLRKNSKDIQNLATERIDQLSHELQQAKRENDKLRAENENLKSATKGIETDLKIYNSQLEEPIPSSESDSPIMEELKKCRITNTNLEMKLKSLQESDEIKQETDCCKLLRKELERCRDTNTQIEMSMSNLNRVQNVEESESVKDLQMKLELCRDANAQLESTIKCLRSKADKRINASDDVVIKIEEQLEVEMCVRKQLQRENCELKAALQEREALTGGMQQGQATMQTIYPAKSDFPAEAPLSAEEQQLQGLMGTLQEENQKLQSTIAVKDALITKMQADIQVYTMTTQQPKIIEAGPSFVKSKSKCPASIDNILAENESLKKRIAALESQAKTQTVKKSTATVATSCKQKSECKAVGSLSMCALQAEVNMLREQLKAKSDSSGCSCTILKEENDKLNNKISELQKQLDQGGTSGCTCTAFKEENEKLNKKISELQKQLSQGGTSGCTCTAFKEENEKLHKRISDLQEELNKSGPPGCTCVLLKNENDKLNKNIFELQEELNNFKKSVTKYIPPSEVDGPSLCACSTGSQTHESPEENMELEVHSTALSPVRRAPDDRNLPSDINEQLLMENVRLQAQMIDLKSDLQQFTCMLSCFESGSDINILRQINEDLTVQVAKLKDEVNKLSAIKYGAAPQTVVRGSSSCGIEDTQMCPRVQLLLEEIQRLKQLQCASQQAADNSEEVEHLKNIIIQQERDVDKLRNDNSNLQRVIQDYESIMCLSLEEQACKSISSLKIEITELKCENQCLRACLKATNPAEESSAISKLGAYTTNKDLRGEVEELRNELAIVRNCTAARSCEKELDQLRQQYGCLEKSYKMMQDDNSKVCQELCKAKDEQTNMNNELGIMKRRLAELERDKCKLLGQLDSLEESTSIQLANVTRELQNKIRLMEEEKLRMKREQQELLERLEQSVNRCSAQESELEGEIQRLKYKIKLLEKINCSLESDFASCQDELEKVAKNRIKELEDKLKQAKDDKAHLEARLCKMTYEQDELTKKLEDKIRESNEREIALESEMMKLKGQIKSLEDENMDLERKLEEAQYALEKLEEEIKEKISNLEQQLEKLGADNRRLLQEKEKFACESNFLRNKVNDLEVNCSQLGNVNAAQLECKEQLGVLQCQYEHCMEENNRLLGELEKLKQEKIDMKNEITELLDKLQICDVNLADSGDKEQLEELVKKMEVQLKNCDIKCKDTNQLDLELQRLLEENARLKLQCEEEKRALEEQFEKSLALLKEQYDRDVEFVRGRHSEGIVRLQDMHEDTVSDTVKEYEREIENLQRQLADLMKQKQFDDETIKKQLEELDKLRHLAEVEVDACRRECKELRTGTEDKLRMFEDENTKLKAELEIAKKCCEELNKQKHNLEEEKSKLKTSLNDLTRASMEQIVKMRGSLDDMLQMNDTEMAKMKDYVKSLEAELDKARNDLENEKRRLNDEISRLKAELDSAKKCCEELERLSTGLDSSRKKSDFNVEQAALENAKLKGQLDLLNDELANEKKRLGAEIDRLKTELEKALRCCDDLEAIKRNLNKDNGDLENELTEQRNKCLDELDKLKKLQAMNDQKYEDLIAQLRAEIAEYKKCCEELDNVKQELESYAKKLKGAGDAEQKSKQDLLNLQMELEKQKKDYELEIARLKRELEDKMRLEDELAKLKQDLAAKQKCCDDLEKMKSQLQSSNANLQNAYSSDTAKCEEELAKIKAELSNIKKQYEDEIAKLKKELENCKNSMSDLQKQNADLENSNKTLRGQVDKASADSSSQLEKLRAESEETKKRLEDEIARLKKELAAKQKCCDDLEAIQKQLDAKNKELAASLESGNKDCEEELAKLKKEMENLRKKYDDELSKLKSDLDGERKRAEEAMAKLKKELDEQTRKNDDLENLKKNLEKQLGDARSKCDENLDNCLEELAKLKKDLERNKKRYEDEIDKLKVDLAEKSKCCSDLENMQKELDKANKALQASKDDASKRSAGDIDNLKKDLEDTKQRYEEKLTKLRDEMDAQRKQYEDEINKLKGDLAKYKKCCDELDEMKLALQNEKMRLESEINKLKQDLQNEKDNRKRDIDELNNELEKSKQCCKDLEAAKKELESIKSRYEKEMENLTKNTKDESKRCADDLAECKKKLEELKSSYEAEIERLKKEIAIKAKCCEELETLKSSLLDDNVGIKKHYEDEINRLSAEIEKGKKCCEDLEEAKKQLAKAKEDCEDQLRNLKAEVEKLTEEKNNLSALMKEMEDEKAELSSKLNQLEAQIADSESGNKALQDCRDQLLEEKKHCEEEMEKLRQKNAELEEQIKDMRSSYEDEINRLKELVKKGEKCCEELDAERLKLKSEVDVIKERRMNSRDSATQERPSRRDSETQDTRPITRDSATQDTIPGLGDDSGVKICPCGAIAKERGLRLRGQREMRPSQQMSPQDVDRRRMGSPKETETEKKLDKLSKATALIVEVQEGNRMQPRKFTLTKKSILITNVEPSLLEANKQIISVEETRPVNLTRSIESILSKALRVGLENLTREELKGLHGKTKDAVSAYEPDGKRDGRTPSGISESELALNKLPLQRRISQLENELLMKQQCACQKMHELENKILTERQQMIDMQTRSISEQQKLGWENKSLKQQASYQELRLEQLLAQIELEKARSSKLKSELMKAKAMEGQLVSLLEQSKVQGQCSYVEGKLHPSSCAKSKMLQKKSIVEPTTPEQKPRSSKVLTDGDKQERLSGVEEPDNDSSEGKGDEKRRRSSSKKSTKKK